MHKKIRNIPDKTDDGGKNTIGNRDGAVPPGPTDFDLDMETLESMDLEKVTDKIRKDCRTVVQQLDLEQLMER